MYKNNANLCDGPERKRHHNYFREMVTVDGMYDYMMYVGKCVLGFSYMCLFEDRCVSSSLINLVLDMFSGGFMRFHRNIQNSYWSKSKFEVSRRQLDFQKMFLLSSKSVPEFKHLGGSLVYQVTRTTHMIPGWGHDPIGSLVNLK